MRCILHSDLNNFYASVECVYHPELRGRPIAVCGDPQARHGIVLAKNEPAKAMGVKTGEAIWQARQKCPELHVLPPNFKRYMRFARQMREIYADYTDFIEPFGLDEAWLDVTGHRRGGEEIAEEIRSRAKSELGLTVSVGVSFNKVFAKLGSDMKKPDAVTVISMDNFRQKVWPLPVEDMLYVGPATMRKLHSRNIRTIGELANCDAGVLRCALGKNGEMIWNFARGKDCSPVMAMGEATMVKSVGNSTTTPRDLVNDHDVHLVLLLLAESVAERLRAQALRGSVVSLYVRDCELDSFTARRKLLRPTALSNEIASCAQELFRSRYSWERPIRSLGVSVSELQCRDGEEQLSMFPDLACARRYDLEEAVEDIRRRFGHYAIGRASLLADEGLNAINPKDEHVIHPVGWQQGRAEKIPLQRNISRQKCIYNLDKNTF